ncbi:nucleotide sugar dehydrogenase [Paenibacillus sp. FSL K6-3182]|uniref:nucleotide sugar dehydrogenase n=1 Tax=Paenibacillus sp. FSL K6-3182 TaxID=2921495 RepID=UPI0030D23A48
MSDLHNHNAIEKQRTVAIVGLGYVGLPLALLFVRKGFNVVGIDLDRRKVESIQLGKSYINEIKDQDIQEANLSDRFTVSNEFHLMDAAEAIVICVPTPLTAHGTPDLSYLTQAAKKISSRLKRQQLVILESSTYPGTTREVLLPVLNQTGLNAGIDYHIAYSPERVDPGNKHFDVESIPKVISGVTPGCLERVKELYNQIFIRVHPVSSTDTAEMTKILENAYRLVNISFINEMALICDAIHLNVWEIIEAASTKPFGYNTFYPGPGIGGHCIPVDPSYLAWKLKQYGITSDFIHISNTINDGMPLYITQQLEHYLAPKALSETRIMIYGVAYKPDIADYRESAAIGLIQSLHLKGADVVYHDPYVPSLKVDEHKLVSLELSAETLSNTDCVIIATDHTSLPLELVLEHAPFVYDTRNVVKGITGKSRIVTLGSGGS